LLVILKVLEKSGIKVVRLGKKIPLFTVLAGIIFYFFSSFASSKILTVISAAWRALNFS